MRLDFSLGIDDDDDQANTVQFELPEQRNPDSWKRLAKWAKTRINYHANHVASHIQ